MNRKQFGALVQALRKEHDDPDGQPWTQQSLAEYASLPLRTLQDIETGRKRVLDESLLRALCDALELTSGERREFFLAASGVEHGAFTRPELDPKAVLETLLSQPPVQLPAYIIDSYCNVVAANPAVVALLRLDAAGLQLDASSISLDTNNMLRFVFSDEAYDFYAPLMGRYWDDYAFQNMMIFRSVSLHHRAEPAFQHLLRALMRHRQFRHHWAKVCDSERDHILSREYIRVRWPEWGRLVCFSTSFVALTPFRSLYYSTYVPASEHTRDVFTDLVRRHGASLQQATPWPWS